MKSRLQELTNQKTSLEVLSIKSRNEVEKLNNIVKLL